jgi:serine protease
VGFARRDRVTFAVPNYVAHAAAVEPVDRGTQGIPGGWAEDQWNLLDRPGGIRVRAAWERLEEAGAPGARGTTVAVVDTGVAYAESGPGGPGPAPDFGANQFVPGTDLIDDDSEPFDANGHGTHVAGTIGEQITLGKPGTAEDYLVGIAYGAKLMPIRALDGNGNGAATDIAKAIRWATSRGADVINLSLQFDDTVTSCDQVPTVCKAVRKARKRGALVVAAGGNAPGSGEGERGALFPAGAPGVLGVSATTEHGCLAEYSHYGPGIDLVAPGGGPPRAKAVRPPCVDDGRAILQLTYACFPNCLFPAQRFDVRADTGTSMASAHVSAVAAAVFASGAVGRKATPRQVAHRLKCTARSPGARRFYRAGLLDASRAVRPKVSCRKGS